MKNEILAQLKKLLYQGKGEPYSIPDHRLRFTIGTRPVRMKYANSQNDEIRFDALQSKFLISNLREGDTAIDVGANVGSYSVIMSALCGKTGHVIAFEPHPEARKVIDVNFNLNPTLKKPTIVPAACSDAAGKSKFFCYPSSARSMLVKRDLSGLPPEEIEVDVVTLDDFLLDHQLGEIKLIKIDVEGAEVAVLRGAREILESKAIIICELHPFAWPSFGTSAEELTNLISLHSRRIRYLDSDNSIRLGEHLRYGTVVLESIS
jgi:FkbM family methyltransferase